MAEPGITPLDRAYALRLAGDRQEALRLAGSLLTAYPEDVGSALLCAMLLQEAGRAAPALALAERCVDAFVRRGDLPSACVAATVLERAGGDPDAMLSVIAKAFGAGSPRVHDEGSLRPPPLPRPIPVAPFFAQQEGAALLDAVEKASARFRETSDSVPPDRHLPRLPLFSALPPGPLKKLLARLALRELAQEEYALVQDEPGREAFVLARGVLNAVRKERQGLQLLAVLGPGAIFGEMALVSSAPRAASVVAVEAVQVLAIPRDALEDLAADEPAVARELGAFCHRRMIGNLLRHSPILSAVSPSARGTLIGRFATRHLEPGELLVRRGDEPSRLYLIASGGVQVRGRDEDGDGMVLAELGPGHVVGEISLVLRRPANADVVAIHPTVVLSLSRDEFREIIKEHPALLRELYEIAVEREEETQSVVAQKADEVSDTVLI